MLCVPRITITTRKQDVLQSVDHALSLTGSVLANWSVFCIAGIEFSHASRHCNEVKQR